jgi:hypothetical protein
MTANAQMSAAGLSELAQRTDQAAARPALAGWLFERFVKPIHRGEFGELWRLHPGGEFQDRFG